MGDTDSAKTFVVERTIEISAPAARVYDAIVDFHRWTEWSPWEAIDPHMYRGYSGPDAGVGAKYEWAGNRKAGSGRMEIVGVDEPSRIDIQLEFVKPFKSHSQTRFTIAPAGETTSVTWSMTGPKTFTTKLMGVFMSMDKMIGGDFEKGLTALKATAEQ